MKGSRIFSSGKVRFWSGYGSDFGRGNVGFWSGTGRILVVETLDFGWKEVGFWSNSDVYPTSENDV
jgi:hypothetical protein